MVEERTNLNLEEKTRIPEYVMARAVYWGICDELHILTKVKLAKTLNRHHASVCHSIKNNYQNLDLWNDKRYIKIRDEIKEHIVPLMDQYDFAVYEYTKRRGPELKRLRPNDFYKEKLIRLRYRFGRLLHDLKAGQVEDVVKEMETIKEEQCFI